jgi:hypothetical protein
MRHCALWTQVLRIDPLNASAPLEIKKIESEKEKRSLLDAKLEIFFNWHKNNQLPGAIYTKSVELLTEPDSNTGDSEIMYRKAIDDALNGSLTIQNLIRTWRQIEKSQRNVSFSTPIEERSVPSSSSTLTEERPVRSKSQQQEGQPRTAAGALRKEAPKSWEQKYIEAEGYYRSGDYNSALLLLVRCADEGNADAMVLLGDMYNNGHGVDESATEAISCYRKSAEAGNSTGMTKLGAAYQQCLDYSEAEYWYSKAAYAGNQLAEEKLDRLVQRKKEELLAADPPLTHDMPKPRRCPSFYS